MPVSISTSCSATSASCAVREPLHDIARPTAALVECAPGSSAKVAKIMTMPALLRSGVGEATRLARTPRPPPPSIKSKRNRRRRGPKLVPDSPRRRAARKRLKRMNALLCGLDDDPPWPRGAASTKLAGRAPRYRRFSEQLSRLRCPTAENGSARRSVNKSAKVVLT